MTLTLEILAGWIAFNVAFAAWRIWISRALINSNPEPASSGDVAVAGNSPLPGQRPSRTNSVGLMSKEVLP
jgi:hypothetical protein